MVRKVLNSLLPEGGRYGGQEGFKLIMVVRKVLNSYQKAVMVVRKVLN